ncbi:hypothetical protein ACKLNR_002826 [Fusarium oxysporum f. sp. zingiberi]
MSAIRDREEDIGFTPGVGQDNSIERDAVIGEQEKGERRPPAHNDLDSIAWSGADDPANPKNWSNKRKWLNITVLSLLTVVTPLGSSMFAPGIPSIMAEFHETSPNAATFILSIYVLGFVFGPILIAPLSETYGRRKLYIWGNILFTIFSVGTALSNSMGMLLGFRFSMGFAGVVPITIGSGSIADMMALETRGRAISIWALGPLLGPCIGPVAGGYLIRAKGWRWVYWLISIISGVLIPISTFLLDETFAPVILQRRNASLPQDTTNSAVPNRSTPRPVDTLKFRVAALRPTKLLFLAPLVTLSALYIAISYGILYLLIATFSFVYPQQYGFDEGTSGLAFIPAGIGMILGVIGIGQVTDLMVKRNKLRGVVHQPKFRLVPIITIPCRSLLSSTLWYNHFEIHIPDARLYYCLKKGKVFPSLFVSLFLTPKLSRFVANAPTMSEFKLYHYDPSFTAAIIFLALFSALTLCHLFQLIRYRTFYLVPFLIGCIFEAIGYAGRAISAKQTPDWAIMPYVLQSLLLLLGPTMLAASIYMSLGRLIKSLEADSYSLVPIEYLTKTFVIGDVISFLAQSGGGGMLANAKSKGDQKLGQNIIIVGLAVQIYFFAFFITILHIFHRRITANPTSKSLSSISPWKQFVLVLYVDSGLIMIRSLFRLVEYITGSNGALQSTETYIYVFDASMIFITVALFNVVHPGRAIITPREPEETFHIRNDSASIPLQNKSHLSPSIVQQPFTTSDRHRYRYLQEHPMAQHPPQNHTDSLDQYHYPSYSTSPGRFHGQA